MALFGGKLSGGLKNVVSNIKGSGIIASALTAVPIVGGALSAGVNAINANAAQKKMGISSLSPVDASRSAYQEALLPKEDKSKMYLIVGAVVVAIVAFFSFAGKKKRR